VSAQVHHRQQFLISLRKMTIASEDQLLIQCSRVKMGNEAIETASNLMQSQLDWSYILKTSIIQGVAPLFLAGLRQVERIEGLEGVVPLGIIDELQRLYQNSGRRNERLFRVIRDVTKVFEQSGVQALGLKDIQLAREVYADIGLRPMGDIDILIHKKDYKKAAICLTTLGFSPLPDPDTPFILKYGSGQHFQRIVDDVWIDLQWNVHQLEYDIYREGSLDFKIDRMWRSAVPMAINDSHILVPKPEDMLFHLCLHLEGHGYSELILFCDIVELLRCYQGVLDWEYLAEITIKGGAESSIYHVLYLVKCLFNASIPQDFMREIETGYFKGSIFSPLFGNLGPLHSSLDEIRLTASPPAELMREFEAVVREEAVSSMHLYREIDNVASAFKNRGGTALILDGTFSEKVFPDPLLKSFKPVRFFVFYHDLPHMVQALVESGFMSMSGDKWKTYEKEVGITSEDPVLANRSIKVIIRGTIQKGLESLLKAGEASPASKKDIAFRSLRGKLTSHKVNDSPITASIEIHALSPENMILYLGAHLGAQDHNRLFGLNNMLELFKENHGQIDWKQLLRKAQEFSLGHNLAEGLLMVNGLLDDLTLPPEVLSSLTACVSPPRILEWSRYGPDSLERHTDFQYGFFFLLCLASSRGVKNRLKYLLRFVLARHGNTSLLLRLVRKTARGILSLMLRKTYNITDFVYWVEKKEGPKKLP